MNGVVHGRTAEPDGRSEPRSEGPTRTPSYIGLCVREYSSAQSSSPAPLGERLKPHRWNRDPRLPTIRFLEKPRISLTPSNERRYRGLSKSKLGMSSSFDLVLLYLNLRPRARKNRPVSL